MTIVAGILGLLLACCAAHASNLDDALERMRVERDAAHDREDLYEEQVRRMSDALLEAEVQLAYRAHLCSLAAQHAVAGRDAEALAVLGELHQGSRS